MMNITETITNPTPALTVGTVASITNSFVGALPVVINCLTIGYLFVSLCFITWKFYKAVKGRKNEPKE